MAQDRIRYEGQFRFDRRADLEHALLVAREQLALEDDLAIHGDGWMRGFVTRGATLAIELAMPATAEVRFAAAELFETMSRAAVGGSVAATIDGRHVDDYPSGGDVDD